MIDWATVFNYIVQAILGAGILWVAFKKAPAERSSSDASASNDYAQAAKLAAERANGLESEIEELRHEVELVKAKKYRITLEFTVGDPPIPGYVKIEPIIDFSPDITRKVDPKK